MNTIPALANLLHTHSYAAALSNFLNTNILRSLALTHTQSCIHKNKPTAMLKRCCVNLDEYAYALVLGALSAVCSKNKKTYKTAALLLYNNKKAKKYFLLFTLAPHYRPATARRSVRSHARSGIRLV